MGCIFDPSRYDDLNKEHKEKGFEDFMDAPHKDHPHPRQAGWWEMAIVGAILVAGLAVMYFLGAFGG